MDAMRLLNPRLVRQAGSARGTRIAALSGVLAAALVGAGSVVACLLILAPAGAVLAAGLLVAGIGVPVLAARAARGAARHAATARGQLAANLTDLLAGAAELHEPTAHLDPGTRRALLTDVLATTTGRTMLLITHDLDGLDEFDQVIKLEGGKIADVNLLRDPGSGSSATRCPARLRGAQRIPAGGPDRAARFT